MDLRPQEPTQKVDPKHPQSHPGYKAAVKKAEEKLPTLQFKSEGERKDYMRAVNSNPNNLPGLPAFYPPLSMGVFSGFVGVDVEKKDMLPCGKKWIRARYDDKGEGTYYCSDRDCPGFKADQLT